MKKVFLFLVLALLFIQPANAIVCSDSDGFDIYSKGLTTGQESFVLQDFCIGNSVSESSCLNNRQVYVQFECPSGCSEGACLHSQTTSQCEVSGNSISVGGKDYANKCVKSHSEALFEDVLVSYSCSGSGVESQAVYCGDQVCVDDGVARCADPGPAQIVALGWNPDSVLPEDFACIDGGQYASIGGIQYQDSCDGFDAEYGYMVTAIDYSCNGDQLEKSIVDCKSVGKECFKGQCVDPTPYGAKSYMVFGDSSTIVFVLSVIAFLVLALLVFFYFYMRR